MIFRFINKYMKNYFVVLVSVVFLYLLALFLYERVHIYFNKEVFYEVGGKFGGVLILRGDSRKKKIILIERDEELLKFSALLSDDELRYLKNYKGDIDIVYQESPYETIWIKEIRLDGKVFKRN